MFNLFLSLSLVSTRSKIGRRCAKRHCARERVEFYFSYLLSEKKEFRKVSISTIFHEEEKEGRRFSSGAWREEEGERERREQSGINRAL